MKWRFFKALLDGGTSDYEEAERVYRWHITERSGQRMAGGITTDGWKLTLDDYVGSARNVYHSMQYLGFRDEYAPRIDPTGELLDGAHRVACAVALGIAEIPIRQERQSVWAPAWGYPWFVAHKCPVADLHAILQDFAEMRK